MCFHEHTTGVFTICEPFSDILKWIKLSRGFFIELRQNLINLSLASATIVRMDTVTIVIMWKVDQTWILRSKSTLFTLYENKTDLSF